MVDSRPSKLDQLPWEPCPYPVPCIGAGRLAQTTLEAPPGWESIEISPHLPWR